MKKILLTLLALLGVFSSLYAQSTGEILTFPANPAKGFNWGYVLYLPKDMDTSKKLPILFTMNDSGSFNTLEELVEATRERMNNNEHERQIADGVGVPMLIPLVLRVNGAVNAHEWNRAVFIMQDGPLKRLDLQVLAMLQDAKKQLKKRGIRSEEKILVAGFSSAGGFGWRLTMLYPRKVLCAAIGGEIYPPLPLAEYEGTNLIYPVGVYDFETYTGKSFHLREWQKVPILLTNGAQDFNDPLPYEDVFGEEEREISMHVLGNGSCQQRWEKAQEILTPLAPNVQIHTYPNMEHNTVWQDEINFLKQHIKGGPLTPIELTDTSSYPSLIPVRISGLFWGQEAPLTNEREYLQDTDLILQGTRVPRGLNRCAIDILHQQTVVLTKSEEHCFGWLRQGYIQIYLSEDEVKKLKSYQDRTFSVRSHHPEVLEIPADLTFTVR